MSLLLKVLRCPTRRSRRVVCCIVQDSVGSESSTEVTDPGGAVRCTRVFCKNGTFTFGLEQRITEEHGDCEPGIYDKDDRFLQDVDKSKLLNHQSLTINICPREFRLKMQCTSKEKNIEACFRIDDTNSDIQGSNPRDGAEVEAQVIPGPEGSMLIQGRREPVERDTCGKIRAC